MLWVLKRAPLNIEANGLENIHHLMLKYFLYLDLC